MKKIIFKSEENGRFLIDKLNFDLLMRVLVDQKGAAFVRDQIKVEPTQIYEGIVMIFFFQV